MVILSFRQNSITLNILNKQISAEPRSTSYYVMSGREGALVDTDIYIYIFIYISWLWMHMGHVWDKCGPYTGQTGKVTKSGYPITPLMEYRDCICNMARGR